MGGGEGKIRGGSERRVRALKAASDLREGRAQGLVELCVAPGQEGTAEVSKLGCGGVTLRFRRSPLACVENG